MRTPKELKGVLFADWTREEIARASIDGSFPDDEDVRLRNLEVVLPKIDRQLQEELQAHGDVKRSNPHDPFVKEWGEQLTEMQDLVDRGLELGVKHQLWHRKEALCSKCDRPLVRMEQTICTSCRGGRYPTT